ncbi:hypothetical protein VFPPC_16713 [Pochonia chlamydosporia 170]|uniref:Uncharacterized protein n=1 Tax=Pochonia chlamydosporia 170 TaxID=1380566 RepID=A0A179F7P2_METCM|nr:hypothetical protein VFPPC_16713 [Pochonia chlamydosporia 170]OAQ61183.1 hypothetical protein VFPPC_16713 [Pochonia chlamydosporia 170]
MLNSAHPGPCKLLAKDQVDESKALVAVGTDASEKSRLPLSFIRELIEDLLSRHAAASDSFSDSGCICWRRFNVITSKHHGCPPVLSAAPGKPEELPSPARSTAAFSDDLGRKGHRSGSSKYSLWINVSTPRCQVLPPYNQVVGSTDELLKELEATIRLDHGPGKKLPEQRRGATTKRQGSMKKCVLSADSPDFSSPRCCDHG